MWVLRSFASKRHQMDGIQKTIYYQNIDIKTIPDTTKLAFMTQ